MTEEEFFSQLEGEQEEEEETEEPVTEEIAKAELAMGRLNVNEEDDSSEGNSLVLANVDVETSGGQKAPHSNNIAIYDELRPEELEEIQDLQAILPGMPVTRLRRIRKAFKSTLQTPSVLSLVPLLREKMPDFVSSGWLKEINIRNAEFVLDQLREDGNLDTPILNTALQVHANAGNIDKALQVYEEEFTTNKRKPTEYTDRLMLQMLIENKRISRALAFKDKVKQTGRSLDLRSYGSLIEYYGRHRQTGSALMLVQECIDSHGSAPSEHYLKDLRVLCRQNGMEHDPKVKAVIGEDPNRWLKHGERFLKRDRTKKGRRDVNLASI